MDRMAESLPEVGDLAHILKCVFCGRTFDLIVTAMEKTSPGFGVMKAVQPYPDWECEDGPYGRIGSTIRSVCTSCEALGCTLAQKGIQSDRPRLEKETLEHLLGDTL